jgi:hypothetical protein
VDPSVLVSLLVDPGVRLEMPMVVEPVHGDGDVMLGTGTVISGLTPPLPISVEPSGIAPPFSLRLALAPAADSGEAVPLIETEGESTHGVVAEPPAGRPPPSKVEVVPVVPVVPGEVVPVTPSEELPALQVATGAGLKPPGSISVAPSGMPVPVDPIEPGTPSGDVARVVGMVIVV